MMWAGLLLVLCILFVAVLIWKPKKNAAGSVSIQSAVERFTSPSPSTDPMEGEIAIIAEALREREQKRRKAAAMAKLKELLEDVD